MACRSIIINATALGSHLNGISVYLLALLTELTRLRTDNRFIICVTKKSWVHLKDLHFPDTMTLRWAPRLAAPDYGFLGHLFRLLYANYLSLRYPRTLCFNGSQLEAMLFRTKQIITVHDIIPLLVPRNHTRQYWYFKYVLPRALRNAVAIIIPSHASKYHLMETYGLEETKIHVIYHGAEHVEGKGEMPQQFENSEYLLFIGRASAHKNLNGVLQGFCRLQGILPHRLIIAGDANNGRDFPCPSRDADIEFAGYVSGVERTALYRNAALLIFISHHEGFGLPPLEAMANACPVVASRTSCIPEICGDAAYYVDPGNTGSIAEGIRRVATDTGLRATLIQRGLERVKLFSWRISAARHVDLFDRLSNQ